MPTPTPQSPDPSSFSLAGDTSPRRSIATYPDYVDAERAVDTLSDKRFDVSHVAIVGSEMRTVEQVTGRMSTAGAAGSGALQGLTIGFVFALLFGLFFNAPGFGGLVLFSLVNGALFGSLIGALSHAALRGRRDFGSVNAMRADHYDIVVDSPNADEAARILHS